MEYERGIYVIERYPNPSDINYFWSAWPRTSRISDDEKLPALVGAKSMAEINQMVDFVLSVPLKNRPSGRDADGWNKLMTEKGIIP